VGDGSPARPSFGHGAPREILELLELLYAAAVDADEWGAFLTRLGSATRSEVVPFLVWDYSNRAGQCLRVHPLDEALVSEYVAWSPKNVYVRQNPRIQSGEIRVISAKEPEIERSEFYNDWLRPRLGVGHNLSTCVLSGPTMAIHLSPLRDPAREVYGDEEVGLMRTLMPHLLRATALQQRLENVQIAQAGAAEALDRLLTGVFLLDRDESVRFYNRAARDLLGLGDGLSLDREGRLTVVRPAEAVRLKRLVAGACETGAGNGADPGGALRVSRESGRRGFHLLVAPLRLAFTPLAARPPCAVVIVTDPDRPRLEVDDTLRELFGFTMAETRVGHLLAQGRRVTEIAELLDVAEATIRTHLKRLLEKTSSRTQADLMRILCAIPPARGPSGD
jgi:DNA-binding CsgD family transcriptional regulator/PAS domain-containing protein